MRFVKKRISIERQRHIGFIVSWLQIIVSSLTGILFTPFLISSLGQTEYGLYQLMYSAIGYIATLDLGLGGTITRYVIKYDAVGDVNKRNSVIGMCMKIYALLAGIALCAVLWVSANLDKFFINTINADNIAHARLLFIVMGISASLSLFDHAFVGILTAYEKYIATKGLRVVKDISRIVLLVVLLNMGANALALVCVDLAAMVLLLVVDMTSCIRSTPITSFKGKFDRILFREIAVFSAFVFLQVIISQVNSSLDRILLGRFSTLYLVGMYGVAMQIYNISSSIGGVFGGLTLPMVTRCVCSGKSDSEITEQCIRYSRVQCYILLLLLSGFFLFGQHFIRIWLKDTYPAKQLWIVILLLLTPNILEWIETPIFNVMKAKNKQAVRSVLLFSVLVANLFLTVWLVKKIPVYGAAIGTSISCIIGNNILSNIFYHKKIGINMWQFFKGILHGIAPALFLSVMVGLGINLLPISGILGFILKGTLYVAVYATLMYFLGAQKEEQQFFLRWVRGKLLKR